MTTVRRGLPDGQYYLCSSYYENFRAGRSEFAYHVNTEDIIFVFGHFVHESIIAFFQDRPLYLFTGLRDPVERAISHLAQINDIRARGGQPLMSASEYLGDGGNSMCAEITRAFPSLAADIEGTPFEKARGLLSIFDYIYDSSLFDAQADHILAVIEMAGTKLRSDNVTSDKLVSGPHTEFQRQEAANLAARAPEELADDIALYATFRDQFGEGEMHLRLASEPWAVPRERLFAKFPDREAARRAFEAWEVAHLVYEFSLLGKLENLQSALYDQKKRIVELRREIKKYVISK